MYVRTCLHSREPTRSLACKHSCGYNHSLMPSYTLISFLLLGSLGIGKRCFEIRNNSTNSNPFADGFFVLSKAQQGVLRVTRRLFGYCRKVAAARYVLSYSKPFGLLPKALPPVAPPKSGNLFLTCGNRALFLVLDAVQSYLDIQRGRADIVSMFTKDLKVSN